MSETWKLRLATGIYRYRRQNDLQDINLWGAIGGEFIAVRGRSRHSDTYVAPSAGLVYLPTSELSLFVSYGKQYDIINGVNRDSLSFDPEETVAYEVGAKWWLLENSDLHLNVSLFQITVENWKLVDATNILFDSQDGRFRSRGWELSLRGFMGPHWKVASTYSHTNPDVLDDNGFDQESIVVLDFSLEGLPDTMSNLWVQYHWQPFGTRGWSAGAGLTYMGQREHQKAASDIAPID